MTTIHLDKKDVRKPDLVTEELKKGFQWGTSHLKIISFAVFLFVLAGIGYSVQQYLSSKKEGAATADYALIEKDYLKKKESFEKFETTAQQKNQKIKDQVEPQGEKASGDLEKDYGIILQGFQKIIEKHPGTQASIMSTMTMNEIYLKYQKPELALQTTSKIKTGNNLLSSLLLTQKGTIQANLNDCKSALETWGQVLKNKNAQFVHSDVLLKQALCYETMNDSVKATESLNKVIAESKDGAISKTAEKYLRIIKSKLK